MAELLGYASVSKMLAEMTSEEITEWQAYFQLKERYEKDNSKAEEAKQRARNNNY